MPPVVIWTLGALGAAVVAKLVAKEWRRVNNDLDRVRTAPVTEPDRAALPKLQRDPTSGVYRP